MFRLVVLLQLSIVDHRGLADVAGDLQRGAARLEVGLASLLGVSLRLGLRLGGCFLVAANHGDASVMKRVDL